MLVYYFDTGDEEIDIHCKLPRENCEPHNEDRKRGLVALSTGPLGLFYFNRLFAYIKERRNK